MCYNVWLHWGKEKNKQLLLKSHLRVGENVGSDFPPCAMFLLTVIFVTVTEKYQIDSSLV